MGLFDMMGAMGGLGDIEKIGKDFVSFMDEVKAGQAAILQNQKEIMLKLDIAEKHVSADDFRSAENAG